MRKAIFLFMSLLLVALVAIIPSGSAAAKLTSSAEITIQHQAMTPDEEALIKDILDELNQAKKLSNNDEIRKQIDVLTDWVKKLSGLIKDGKEEAAIQVKLLIAERLETVINQVPLLEPTPTSTATAPVTNLPSANLLYDELVRIRAKIDKLIALERRPETIPPPPPEIERPPEMEKLMVYSAKFLCGPAFGKEGVQPGSYSTAINVHNPHNQTVYLYKKAVIAQREDEPRGRISAFRKVILGPDEAIEIDCIDVASLLGTGEPNRLSAPSQQLTQPQLNVGQTGSGQTESGQTLQQSTSLMQISRDITPIGSVVQFVKGFIVIYASAPLDVVGVYTASTQAGFSLDVEYISPSTGVRFTPSPPEEGEECPTGCSCLTEVEAKRLGLNWCQGKRVVCGYDEQKYPKYCYEKPTEQAQCLTGCVCLTKDDAAKRYGTNATTCQDQPCGRDQYQTSMYCWKPTEQTQCLSGCVCLTKDDASKRYGTNATTCQDQPCGRDQYQTLMYCWKPTEQAECPTGCTCATEYEGKKYNYNLCKGQKILCGYDDQKNPLYCYEKPTEQAQCLTGCVCLTKDDAAKRYGYNATTCQDQPCGRDQYQNLMYCWKPTTTTTTPSKPARLVIEPSQDRNPVGTQHTLTFILYDSNGNPMPNVRIYISHTGAHTFAPIELVTDQNGKNSYYYTGTNVGTDTIVAKADSLTATAIKEWYATQQPGQTGQPPQQTQCTSGCTCLTQAEARKSGYTTICQDTPCGYDSQQYPKYCYKTTVTLQPGTLQVIPKTTDLLK